MFTEDYDEERAVAHIRRVLDLVSSTACFGPSGTTKDAAKSDGGRNNGQENKSVKKSAAKQKKDEQSPRTTLPVKSSKSMDVAAVDGDGEMSHSCPKLGSFYEFFSLSHLTPPIQCNFFFYFISLLSMS